MRYNFDQELDRRGTQSIKWGLYPDADDPNKLQPSEDFYGPERKLPLWVADMDFPCPQPVVEALTARAAHPIFGYTTRTPEYDAAVVNWMRRRHQWEVSAEWICITPGIVSAVNLLVRAFVAPGEAVLVQPPVYYPFFGAIQNNGALRVDNPLIEEGGRYRMDFDDLAAKAADPRVKMAILCSPHNPIGRVWSAEELTRFGEICLRHNILVVADEIHADLVFPGQRFTPFASLSPEFTQKSIVCTAPSKTFNIAGLHVSNIFVADAELRARFNRSIESAGVGGVTPFGVVAAQAAYEHGEDWLAQALEYLDGNRRFLRDYLAEHLPQVGLAPLEGTYLAWLDFRALGLSPADLQNRLLKDARLFLSPGAQFGTQGEGFMRLNIACPRSLLAEALERLRQAVNKR